jgi:hypothetical protein
MQILVEFELSFLEGKGKGNCVANILAYFLCLQICRAAKNTHQRPNKKGKIPAKFRKAKILKKSEKNLNILK